MIGGVVSGLCCKQNTCVKHLFLHKALYSRVMEQDCQYLDLRVSFCGVADGLHVIFMHSVAKDDPYVEFAGIASAVQVPYVHIHALTSNIVNLMCCCASCILDIV